MPEDIIKKLHDVLAVFESVCPRSNLPHYRVFMLVAEREGITMPEACSILEMPQASLSRIVKELSVFNKEGMRGTSGIISPDHQGVIKVVPDATHRKRYAMYLTDKGKNLRDEIIKIMKE